MHLCVLLIRFIVLCFLVLFVSTSIHNAWKMRGMSQYINGLAWNLICMPFLFTLKSGFPVVCNIHTSSVKCKNYNNILRILPPPTPPISLSHVGYEWIYMKKCANISVMACVCVVCSSHSVPQVVYLKMGCKD